MIGDSQVDVLTARNAGAWCIGCTFGLAPAASKRFRPMCWWTRLQTGQPL